MWTIRSLAHAVPLPYTAHRKGCPKRPLRISTSNRVICPLCFASTSDKIYLFVISPEAALPAVSASVLKRPAAQNSSPDSTSSSPGSTWKCKSPSPILFLPEKAARLQVRYPGTQVFPISPAGCSLEEALLNGPSNLARSVDHALKKLQSG